MSIPYEPGEALTCGQIRELDVLAIEHVGIPGIVLMENAGRAVAQVVYSLLVDPRRGQVVILCGPGNNGGDGFVVARHLANAEVDVACVLAVPRDRYKGDAAINLGILERIDLPLMDAVSDSAAPGDQTLPATILDCLRRADIVVDALLGTGVKGAPRGIIARLVETANRLERARRIAIDVPTGLDADRGEPGEPCFEAHATVTLVAAKVGFSQPAARRVLGRVIVADIGAPHRLIPGRKTFSDGA
jgi:NAD(P)H-hydrate epimerase